jgi:proteasome lid subunit RPN8/RPN11
MNVQVNRWITQYIKENANKSENEVYGWLIGFENRQDQIIVQSALLCTRYTSQSVVEATPDPREIQEITRSIPNGLYIVGIFHTHPGSVFHSHVDNQTLQNLAKHNPKMLSAVTNGKETKWYQLQQNLIAEIEIQIEEINIQQVYFPIFYSFTYSWAISLEKPLIPQIIRNFSDDFQEIIQNGTISFLKGSPLLHRVFDPKTMDKLKKDQEKRLEDKIKEITFSELKDYTDYGSIHPQFGAVSLDAKGNKSRPNETNALIKEQNTIEVTGGIQFFSFFAENSGETPSAQKLYEYIQGEFFQMMNFLLGRAFLKPINPYKYTLLTPMGTFLTFPDLPYIFYHFSLNLRKISQITLNEFVESLESSLKSSFKLENYPTLDWLANISEEDLNATRKRAESLSKIKPDFYKPLQRELENIFSKNQK